MMCLPNKRLSKVANRFPRDRSWDVCHRRTSVRVLGNGTAVLYKTRISAGSLGIGTQVSSTWQSTRRSWGERGT